MRIPRDYRPFVEAAKAVGWELSTSGIEHIKLTPPAGAIDRAGEVARPFSIPSSPKTGKGARGSMNVRAKFRRAGIKC